MYDFDINSSINMHHIDFFIQVIHLKYSYRVNKVFQFNLLSNANFVGSAFTLNFIF